MIFPMMFIQVLLSNSIYGHSAAIGDGRTGAASGCTPSTTRVARGTLDRPTSDQSHHIVDIFC